MNLAISDLSSWIAASIIEFPSRLVCCAVITGIWKNSANDFNSLDTLESRSRSSFHGLAELILLM